MAAKLDELPLTVEQREEIESDLAGGAGSVDIARKITAWGHPISEAAIRRYRESNSLGEPDRRRVLGAIADLLDRNGISTEDIGKVHRLNVWQGFIKDSEGNPQTVDMAGIQLSPTWETGPDWPAVQSAQPCVVRHGTSSRKPCTDANVTVLLPDPQIGYRRLESGELVPLHDEKAIACALELLSVIHPDRVVNLGDFLDLAALSSKFLVLPEFVLTTQPSVDRGHRFLAEQQAAAGQQCETWELLEGNHDNRLPIAIARNAMEAMRLRQANAPESWPVMSVPHLLRLDELGVTYVDGYPAGRVKIASRHGSQASLYALHGERLSMEKQAKAERISTVQGHAHHFSMHAETYPDDDGLPLDVEAWSLGALCRRDGAVPSTKGGTDVRGRHVERVESWQHGIGVVTETEDGWWLEPVRIHNGKAMYRGQLVTAPTAVAA